MQKWLPAGWRRDVVLQKKAKRRNAHWFLDHLTQRSSRFLAPGTHLWKNIFYKESREGMVQAVTPVMERAGEQQMKLHSLARHIPPALQPGS